jgi:hypothetical protein
VPIGSECFFCTDKLENAETGDQAASEQQDDEEESDEESNEDDESEEEDESAPEVASQLETGSIVNVDDDSSMFRVSIFFLHAEFLTR